MNFLGKILGKLLRLVYDLVSTMGAEPANFSFYAMSIILTTIVFRILLLPLAFKQAKNTKIMNEIQPQLLALQEKYKNDPQNLQVKMMDLYKEYDYNPASGCLPLLIQMPIILAFFKVMRDPVTFAFSEPGFYESMNKTFFWISNLDMPDPIIWGLPLLAAITTYLQTVVMMKGQPSNPEVEATQSTMNIILPIMIFISARSFPAGLALYWVVSNTFAIVQQLITNHVAKREIKEVN